ncbi:uncharacterized protein M6B38_247750 [Iris pallida]|uniref:Calcineurin-like phosphoesterase domain-containing protein n=1 Tax=Iris pallida TaxID=29817 RepID=A0AAX6DG25_IRIPA|nr:uncharacterized protein M6B38_247750 [Iris pallida]
MENNKSAAAAAAAAATATGTATTSCRSVPPLLSYFIDTFVDFSVSGGIFLPPSSYPSQNPNPSPTPPTHYPSPSRLVAIGDLHGDLTKSLQTLSLSRLLDPSSLRWSGGAATAVQVGDVLDRGGDEIKILYLLHRLRSEALASGGLLLTIHGNHEVMNADADFRYVTREGLREFLDWSFWFRKGISMKLRCPDLEKPRNPFSGVPKSFPGVKKEYWEGFRARIAALRPSGPIADRFLSENQTIVVVGDSVFVHGGITREHVMYGLERINEEVRDWIRGRSRNGIGGRVLSPSYLRGRDAVVWLRRFSDGKNCDCEDLDRVLRMMPGATRMVMGHTIQTEGINAVCGDRAIRIDVGLSRGCTNGLPEVLEINDGKQVRILTANPLYDQRRQEKVAAAVKDESKEGLAILIQERRLKEAEVKA